MNDMERTGSIEQLPSGKFRLRFRTPGRRTVIDVYDTWEDAERERLACLQVFQPRTLQNNTIKIHGQRTLLLREKNGEIRDTKNDRSRWENHIVCDAIAKMDIANVRARHLLAFSRRLKQKGLSHQSVQNTLNVLRVVFRECVFEERIKGSPFAALKLPREKQTKEPWTYLRLHEQSLLLDAAPQFERLIIAFAMFTGLRAGELCALRKADIVLDGDPHVVVRYGTPPKEPTKGGQIRRVQLFPPAVDALAQWNALAADLPNPHELAFPTRAGRFRDPDHVIPWATWRDTRAVIGRRVRWHDLRHTCASSLVSGWWGHVWSLKAVQAQLGHASVITTERYAHLGDDVLKQAARETTGWPILVHGEEAMESKSSQILRSRLGDLNPRPAVYENVENHTETSAKAPIFAVRGPAVDHARSVLRFAASQSDAAFSAAIDAMAIAILASPELEEARRILARDPCAASIAINLAERLIASANEDFAHAAG